MKNLVIIALIVTLSGCSFRNVNRATLAASTLSIACDWGQTRAAASTGWKEYAEANPMLGPSPSTTQVDTYFLVAALVNATIWAAMPDKVKSIIPAGIIVVQTDTIVGNQPLVGGVCGIGGIGRDS